MGKKKVYIKIGKLKYGFNDRAITRFVAKMNDISVANRQEILGYVLGGVEPFDDEEPENTAGFKVADKVEVS